MRVLGIDPGLNATGWAVLERLRGRNRLVASGVVRTTTKASMAERLGLIHAGVAAVIAQHQPEGAAIEQVFQHKSSESALRLGHARGVAMVALHQGGLAIGEYNPGTIKKSVAGNGRAGKPEIQRLVAALLGLDKPLPQDASDAAAIALTHLARAGLQARLNAIAAAGARP